jgi:hypothetical protein
MKKSILSTVLGLLLLGSAAAPSAVRGDGHPLFSPEPPAPEALAFLREGYLPALAANDIPRALALTDMRGFRQYLLDVRMKEMKAKLPNMTPEQEKELSAFYQTNNLAPANLAAIVGDSLIQGRYTGLKWGGIGFAPAPEPLQGWLAQVRATAPDGKASTLLVGIKQLGDQWMVAPEIPMDLSFRAAAARRAGMADTPVPEPVEALVSAFWIACRDGDPETAYSLFSPDYRTRIPLLGFLGIYQELVERIGVPATWVVEACRPLGADRLGLGVVVTGSKDKTSTIMVFRRMGRTWVLDEAQFRPPSENNGAAAQSRAHAAAQSADLSGGTAGHLPALDPAEPVPPGEGTAFPVFSGPEKPVGAER